LVVIDEAHMYRGIFGSHVANILRRLFRLCYVYGSSPQVVCCSASIQTPRQHFSWLVPHQSLQPAARTPSDDPFPNTNASPEITVIEQDKDGSPCGTKHFVVWRPTPPPVTSFDPNEPHNPDLTGSTIFQSAQILATLVAAKVPTIAFCRGRKLTELVVEYTHNVLRRQNQSHLIPRVKGYRGGYSVESRRAIEAQLFRHELLGVVATNALELGIDIGSLECTLHLGYPPSIASMWQQAGRAGRSGHDSMAVIVCFDSPLDAYNTSLGSAMFAKPPEPVVLDPTNLFVVKQHLQCASLEMDLLSPRSGTLDIDRIKNIFGSSLVLHLIQSWELQVQFAPVTGYTLPLYVPHIPPQRFATLFVYVNSVDAGGETSFPFATSSHAVNRSTMAECNQGLAVPPVALQAALFYVQTPTMEVDEMASHGGCPPRGDNVKWGANQFMWNADAEEGAAVWLDST
ncbi:hypothetical protein DYB26_010575, partial [Aphanomyces astaci]